MRFYSTRNKKNICSASYAILNGIAEDGGLFVPEDFSDIYFNHEDYIGKTYQHTAEVILKAFFNELDENRLKEAVNDAYNKTNFSSNEIFPLTPFKNIGVLNLTTGNTMAFKDAALSILPYLISISKQKEGINDDILILTATSGDTGKAAMEGFKNKNGIKLLVFYPYKGVSEFQLKQMLTTDAVNEGAFAIRGNFDDAQTAVKNLFNNIEFKKNLAAHYTRFSSANSINIGRLIPQMAYYFHAYSQLVLSNKIKIGDKINIAVPTGNFGNILAAYYAKKTGLPINKLICASNENNVLTDFFCTGTYDANRPFKKTISPSMDILISSNLERLIFELTNRDDIKTSEYMNSLKSNGMYSPEIINPDIDTFTAYYSTEAEIRSTIKNVYTDYNYLIDTHTATAFNAVTQFKAEHKNDDHFNLILETASPFKFAKDVLLSLNADRNENELDSFNALSQETKREIPLPALKTLSAKEKTESVLNIEEMQDVIMDFIAKGGM